MHVSAAFRAFLVTSKHVLGLSAVLGINNFLNIEHPLEPLTRTSGLHRENIAGCFLKVYTCMYPKVISQPYQGGFALVSTKGKLKKKLVSTLKQLREALLLRSLRSVNLWCTNCTALAHMY